MRNQGKQLGRREVLRNGAIVTSALVIGGTASTGTAVAGIGEGRVGHYHLNNLQGNGKDKDTVHDASPYENDGTWNGDVDPVVKGRVGNAFEFDGDDYVEISDDLSPSFTAEVSMAAWVNPEVDDAWKTITALNDYSSGGNSPPALLRATNGGEWEFFLDTEDGTTSNSRVTGGTVETGTWTHVAGTYDGSEVTVYEDGEMVANQGFSGSLSDPQDGMFIGAWQMGGGALTQHWMGKIDEARIYNRALTENEIDELADMG